MSHINLNISVSAAGADFAERYEHAGANAVLNYVLPQIIERLNDGSVTGAIRDANGNTYGHYAVTEVR